MDVFLGATELRCTEDFGAIKELFESYRIDVFCIVFYIYSCDFNNIAIP